MKKILVLVCLFSLIGIAYGEEISLETVKKLGIKPLAMGAVIRCETKDSVGYGWNNGSYALTNYKLDIFILKKVDALKFCNLNLKNGFYGRIFVDEKQWVIYREACIIHNILGEPKPFWGNKGGKCYERYQKSWNGTPRQSIECTSDTTFIPDIIFTEDGLFNISPTYASRNIHSYPANGYKDSFTISWGYCTNITPLTD